MQLTDTRGVKVTVTTEPGAILHTHRGQIPHDCLIGLDEGSIATSTRGIDYLVQRPQLDDYVLGMPRQAAVIYPKDAARIVALGDVGSGSRVLEAGVGSGALTCYLLKAAGPTGTVTSVERRSDFAEVARENVSRWFGGTPRSWTLHEMDLVDVTESDIPTGSQDTLILDMLSPWECLDVADRVLRAGGPRQLRRHDNTAVTLGRIDAPVSSLDRAASRGEHRSHVAPRRARGAARSSNVRAYRVLGGRAAYGARAAVASTSSAPGSRCLGRITRVQAQIR